MLRLRLARQGLDFDRHVRTTQLTQPAGCAVFRPFHGDLFILVQFKNPFRTKGNADSTPLAEILVGLNLCPPFLFGHLACLSSLKLLHHLSNNIPLSMKKQSNQGKGILESWIIDDFAKSRKTGRHSKKSQMQGARILRNEAYIEVRCNDER
jgi:hypothetical protein